MSLDEQRLHDGLTGYAVQVSVSEMDVDRMYEQFRTRAGKAPAMRRRRYAVAAAVLLVAALAVAGIWLRRPQLPPPAKPDVRSQIGGTWLAVSNTGDRSLLFLNADGTFDQVVDSAGVLNPPAQLLARWSATTDTLVIDAPTTPGLRCTFTIPAHPLDDGRWHLDAAATAGAGCTSDLQSPPQDLTRLYPTSAAGVSLSADMSGSATAVTTPGQLTGVWLLTGTPTLLAVDDARPNVSTEYRLDNRGTIDGRSQDRGVLTVTPDGRVVIHSLDPGTCDDTILGHPVVHPNAVTADVTADPCHHFPGRTTLTWARIL